MTDYELLRRYDEANLPVADENYLPAVVEFLAEALDTHLVAVPGTDEYLLFAPAEDSNPERSVAPPSDIIGGRAPHTGGFSGDGDLTTGTSAFQDTLDEIEPVAERGPKRVEDGDNE